MPKRKRSRRKQPSTLFILAGIVLLVSAVILIKNARQAPASAASLEDQYNQAIQEKQPTFVFLHSLDCIPCEAMMEVVAQVYPEFEDRVVLIDVDVYDQRNVNIMRREGLQMIPTLVFYDQQGVRQMQVGVLEPNQLRAILQGISGAN